MGPDRDISLAIRLFLESRGFATGLKQGAQQTRAFASGVRKDMHDVRNTINAVRQELAMFGVGYAAVTGVVKSARLDKSLIQIQQTAGATRKEAEGLRVELFRMAKETGQEVENLKGGFDQLVQAGLNWKEASTTINAINPVLTMSTVSANDLSRALSVAARAFEFDLSDLKTANKLLDQMVIAGGLGSAELNNLPDIFARVGVNARASGMDFAQTLGFIETLSQFETQPERLATLADSTLRLFTNEQYKKKAMMTTGVDFYNKDLSSRDPFSVLEDISKRYQSLKTDADRARFVDAAFGDTDLDTRRGLRMLFQGNNLDTARKFSTDIGGATGEVQKRLAEALDNSVDQVGRLKAALRDAADSFMKPINAGISKSIQFLMNPREKGGLGLSGGEMILGTGAVLAGGYLGGKLLKNKLGKLAGLGNVATGVAAGKALEQAAGVMPVYVVNMPEGGLGGSVAEAAAMARGGRLSGILARSGPLLARAGALGLAGYGGWEVGSKINEKFVEGTSAGDVIGRTIARVLALMGNETAKESLELERRNQEKMSGELRITIDQDGRARVSRMKASENLGMEVDAGMLMAGGM